MEKRKYYFVHLLNDFSGSPRVLRDALDIVEPEMSDLTIVTSSGQGFLNNVHRANYLSNGYKPFRNKLLKLASFFFSQFVMFLQLFGIGVANKLFGKKSVVVVNTLLPFGAALGAKLSGSTVIYYIHETSVEPKALKSLLRFFVNYCANEIVFVSKFLSQKEKFSRPKSRVIYNTLRSDFSFCEPKFELKFSNKTILFCGSLRGYKGIYRLLELAKRLPDFKFIAALNCQNFEFSGFLDENTVPDNLRLLQRPENLHELFEESFLVLNLTVPQEVIETFGLSVLEGMASGSPVICPPVGGPLELVSDDCGIACDSANIDDMVAFINRLGHSYDCWLSYSRAAYERAKLFSRVSYKKELKKLLFHDVNYR